MSSKPDVSLTVARSLLEISKEAFWFIDPQRRLVFGNAAFLRELRSGLGVSLSVGDDVVEKLASRYPEHRERLESMVARALKGEQVTDDVRFLVNNEPRDYRAWLYPLVENGKVAGVCGSSKNLNPLKRAEEALLASRDLSAALFKACPMAISVMSLEDGRVLDLNDSFETLMGFRREEMIGRTTIELGIWPDPSRRWDLVKSIRETGRVGGLELELHRKGGEPISVYASFVVTAINGQELLVSIAENITARKRSEQMLRQSEERFSKIFHASPMAILLTARPDERVLDANETFSTLSGYSREELLGRTTHELKLFGETARLEELSRFGSASNLEVKLHPKHGGPRLALGGIVTTEVGGAPRLVSVWKDITDRKLWEDRARQAQKMEALGLLAGGVAHDFNNLLTVILGATELMLRRMNALGQTREQTRKALQQIQRATSRAARLTQQLLTFGRKQPVQPDAVDSNERIEEVADLLRRTLGGNIQFKLELQAGIPPLWMDPIQLEQVVMNLVLNARDAMPNGGTLRLRTRLLEPGSRELPADFPAKRCVLLEVSDSGEGMSPEVQARVFEPFFTTKAEGQGTGLGLSSVYGIIQQSGGQVRVESHVGQGTTFRLFLPLKELQSPAPGREEPRPSVH